MLTGHESFCPHFTKRGERKFKKIIKSQIFKEQGDIKDKKQISYTTSITIWGRRAMRGKPSYRNLEIILGKQ